MDKDWIGIRKIGEGSKGGDQGKVGRFGLGINSLFHLSDTISILSGKPSPRQ
jgi:HSP90 family molecular chaperone